MKLTSALVNRTLSQFPAEAIPDNHPARPQLVRIFGDHTFFLDRNGLHIVEPSGRTQAGETVANVVKLASWEPGDQNSLTPHEPEPTDVVVQLGSDDPNSAA